MKYILTILLFVLVGCDDKNDNLRWLSSDIDSAYVQIERQFRRFDMAMQEVGYRYTELYFAGQDDNWSYAKYHLDKIKTAIDNGLERRPKRALSAHSFINSSIPSLINTIKSKNRNKFLKEFDIFRQACNSCHISEKVEFVKVVLPETRYSPVNLSNSQE